MQDDASLVAAFQSGDQTAFEELYQRYVRRIYDFVYYRTHHRETAEDIVSQAFLQAVEKIDSFKSKKGTFSAWLHRIARNLMVDHFRKTHPTQSIEDAWDLPSGDNTAEDAENAMQLEKARVYLSALKSDQRDIVLLRLWHGYTFAEIAETLGTTEAACKMSYKRTMEKLSTALCLILLFLSLSFLS